MNSHASAPLGLEHQRHVEVASKRQRMKLIIVDRERRVLLDSIDPAEHELRLLLSDDRTALRVDIDDAVEALIDQCVQQGVRHSRIAFLDAQRFVRVTRLDGPDRCLFADALKIAETTVQGYYKRLLSKTQSRNRPAMVANVLDWGGSGRQQSRSVER